MKNNEKALILVLGSNSFSGASFIKHLLIEGYKVIGISRAPEVTLAFRPYQAYVTTHNFFFQQVDLNLNPERVADIVEKYNAKYIVNFAAQSMVAQSWQFPDHWYQTNVVSLANICKYLLPKKSIKKFIHFTTPEVYGSTSGWLRESFDFAPSTPYAVSRAAGDWHLRCLFEKNDFPVVFTRAANVYGPGQQLYRIVPRTIISALTGKKLPLHGGGTSIRSFIHMKDVSKALEIVMEKGQIGESYHISTNELISVFHLVKNLSNLLAIELEELIQIVPERPGKDFVYQLSSEKIRTDLGWKDEIDLAKGLSETLHWTQLHLDELKNLSIEYEHKR